MSKSAKNEIRHLELIVEISKRHTGAELQNVGELFKVQVERNLKLLESLKKKKKKP